MNDIIRVPVRPQPIEHATVTGPMISHVSMVGQFAPHVFGACLAQCTASPFDIRVERAGDGYWEWVISHKESAVPAEPKARG